MRAEVALQESERRFREMADLLPDMVFELDRDFRFTYANRAASETMGYPQVGTDTRLVGVLAEALLMRTTENPTPPLDSRQALMGVYDVRREDGTHLPIEVHGTRILGPEGEVAGYRGVGRNITDRKQAEAERLAAISQFAAGVAHDFGSLLATMRSWARLAEEHQPAHDEDLVEVVMRATAQGLALTDQLRAIVRVGDVLIKPVLIEDAIESVLTVTKQQLAASAVEVVRQYQPDGRAAAVDQAQMRRVFLNLIINAQQAMPEGGTLTVATRYPSPALGEMGVVVTFTDTGVGIAPEYLPHIFEPFFYTKGSYGDGRWSGIGLGLSVSHGIVTAHEGTMCVGSEVGVGTTFEVHLPLARSTSSSATWAEKLPALLTPPDEHQEA
ncbi:MAG: ATP-binding protein [Armatimonadota bacterium]